MAERREGAEDASHRAMPTKGDQGAGQPVPTGCRRQMSAWPSNGSPKPRACRWRGLAPTVRSPQAALSAKAAWQQVPAHAARQGDTAKACNEVPRPIRRVQAAARQTTQADCDGICCLLSPMSSPERPGATFDLRMKTGLFGRFPSDAAILAFDDSACKVCVSAGILSSGFFVAGLKDAMPARPLG